MCDMIVETTQDNKKEAPVPEIISEEDKQVNHEIELFMTQMRTDNDNERLFSINDIKKLLKLSTSSMTSVPTPLKFMIQHIAELEKKYSSLPNSSMIKKPLSDLISVIAMLDDTNNFEKVINYCLAGTLENISGWGHEYVRHLCLSLSRTLRIASNTLEPLYVPVRKLFDDIGPFLLYHNAETELCDVLSDISNLHWLLFYIDESNYSRICLYLEASLFYTTKDSESTISVLHDIYFKFDDYLPALRIAVRYNRTSDIVKCANFVTDDTLKNQMAFFLSLAKYNDASIVDSSGKEFPFEIIGNCNYSKYFIRMARDLDAMQPRIPEDVFKCGASQRSIMPDRIKAQLASVFANGFVHAGFKTDYGMNTDGNAWIYANKSNGLISATASIGLINLWDIEIGLGLIDKYFYAEEDEVKGGAYLACGIICSGQAHECEPSIALLSAATKEDNFMTRHTSIMAFGISYAGTNNETVINILIEALFCPPVSAAIVGYACYSIGLVAVASMNFDLVKKMVESIKSIPGDQWENEFSLVYAFLGIAYVQLGQNNFLQQENVKSLISSNFKDAFAQLGLSIVEMFFEEENGLVYSVENLLSSVGFNIDSYLQAMVDRSREKATWANDLVLYRNGIEVISLAIKSCTDDISVSMMTRILDHIMRFGEAGEKRAVPLALSLLYVSNPNPTIIETLAKYSHDLDQDVVTSAIISMGIIGAGTNNARLSSQLRNLASQNVSSKNTNFLFAVRIAQSFLFMGKGTLSLSPFVCDKFICKRAALVAVVGFLVSFLDSSKAILGNCTHHMYMIVPAISSRMLVTYDENLEPLTVLVRVGQAVDLAGQTGKPRSITGFQTHNTPVLLSHGERAELATNEYISLTPYLQGVVILKKNPDYVSG